MKPRWVFRCGRKLHYRRFIAAILATVITHADGEQEALVALERRVAEGLARMEFLAARMESVDQTHQSTACA
jgi:hypothetical protein